MRRRTVLKDLSAFALSACGGARTAHAAASPSGQSSSLAVWGDSLARGVAPALAREYPDRAVFNGGNGGNTSVQVADRMLADALHTDWITVLWAGRNNVREVAQVMSDLTACVRHLRSDNQDRFVVLSVLNGRSEPKGSAGYSLVMTLNAALATAFPGNYLDIRAHLASLADPAVPQDLIDQAKDLVPSSLRSDALHLNVRGNAAAAARIKASLDSRGW